MKKFINTLLELATQKNQKLYLKIKVNFGEEEINDLLEIIGAFRPA